MGSCCVCKKNYNENKPITIKEISRNFNVSSSTALKYIQKGERLGWCKYDTELLKLNRAKGIGLGAESTKRKVGCYDLHGVFLRSFDSINEAARHEKIFATAIVNCCKGKTVRAGQHIWKYL